MFEKRFQLLESTYLWQRKALYWAEDQIRALQLEPLVELAERVDVEDAGSGKTVNTGPRGELTDFVKTKPTGRYLKIYMPMDLLEETRRLFIRSEIAWTKYYYVVKEFYGREGKMESHHRIYYEVVDDPEQPWGHRNSVQIIFYREVQEGEEINGCVVIRQPSKTYAGDLVLACEKK